MAKEGAERGEHRKILPAVAIGDQRGNRSLEGVEEKGQRGKPLAAGAQHVRRSDIAGADRAQVRCAGKPRQDEPEGDRAEQIAERERGRVVGQRERPIDWVQHGAGVPEFARTLAKGVFFGKGRASRNLRGISPKELSRSSSLLLRYRLEHDDFGLVRSASPAVVMPRGGGASSNHGERLCLLDRPLARAKTVLRADSTSIHPAPVSHHRSRGANAPEVFCRWFPPHKKCEGARNAGAEKPRSPVCGWVRHTGDSRRRICRCARRPARGVCRLAPHAPRWTDR